MKPMFIVVCVSLSACNGLHERQNMPRPPVCVRGGARPVIASMEDYGSTYTPEMQPGPAPAAPDSYLVSSADAGADCVAPPWWDPPSVDHQ